MLRSCSVSKWRVSWLRPALIGRALCLISPTRSCCTPSTVSFEKSFSRAAVWSQVRPFLFLSFYIVSVLNIEHGYFYRSRPLRTRRQVWGPTAQARRERLPCRHGTVAAEVGIGILSLQTLVARCQWLYQDGQHRARGSLHLQQGQRDHRTQLQRLFHANRFRSSLPMIDYYSHLF